MNESAQSEVRVFKPKGATSWVLYDVANTVYAAAVAFIAAPYAAKALGASTQIGIVNTVSMGLSGLAVPVMAALADRTGKAQRYLTLFTFACIVSLAMFGVSSSLVVFLVAFGIANFTYNSALVFYNSLLPSVCKPEKAGLISGLGVGLGYAGTLATVFLLLPFASAYGERPTFVVAAALFLLLSLPCIIRVRDRRLIAWEPFSSQLLKSRFIEVSKTLKGLRKDKPMGWFLLGNFLCVDVLNTAILFFTIYVVNVATGSKFTMLGMDFDLRVFVIEGSGSVELPTESGYTMLMGASLNIAALIFGVLIGKVADRINALRVLGFSALSLLLALVLGFVFAPRTVADGLDKKIKEAVESHNLEAAAANENFRFVHDPEALQRVEATLAERAESKLASVSSSVPAEKPKVSAILASESEWSPVESNAFFLAFAVLGACGLAGIWTAGRKVLLELAPQDRVAEYFGLYGITVKLSVIGSTTFALIWTVSDVRTALLCQTIPLGLGIFCLFMTGRAIRAHSVRTSASSSALGRAPE